MEEGPEDASSHVCQEPDSIYTLRAEDIWYQSVWPRRSNPLLTPTVHAASRLVHKREAGERREKGNLQSLSGSLQATLAKGWLWIELIRGMPSAQPQASGVFFLNPLPQDPSPKLC